jgi:hypothetical protein
MKKLICLLLLPFLFSGCQNDDSSLVNQPDEQNNEPVVIAFEQVAKGSFPMALFPFSEGNFAIHNDAEWTAFRTHPATAQVVPLTITPDFTNYTYLAVRHHFHTGTNPDVKINIESVTEMDGTITVKYIKTTYDEGDVVLTIESHPYHMVRIPATTLPIVFEQL